MLTALQGFMLWPAGWSGAHGHGWHVDVLFCFERVRGSRCSFFDREWCSGTTFVTERKLFVCFLALLFDFAVASTLQQDDNGARDRSIYWPARRMYLARRKGSPRRAMQSFTITFTRSEQATTFRPLNHGGQPPTTTERNNGFVHPNLGLAPLLDRYEHMM